MRRRTLWITGSIAGVIAVIGISIYYAVVLAFGSDPFMPIYADNCSVCHGENMTGTSQRPAPVGNNLEHGDTVAELFQSISGGFP